MRVVFLDCFAADQGEGPASWPGLDDVAPDVQATFHPRVDVADLAARCADADALITNKVPISGELMRTLQPRLRYVGVSATGYNIVDVAAARALGVAVTNVPAYSTDSVAQLTFALLLQLALDVAGHDAAVRRGAWAACPDFAFFLHPLPELRGRTLLVVGLGAIGGAVARIAEAFGMRVLAAQVPGTAPRPGRVALPEALPDADVVSLHCPLTAHTQGLVGREFLARMKPGAFLLNTARGGLVDEAALLDALAEGRIGGAGLDVLSAEPPPADHPLVSPPRPLRARLVVTPHIGWGSVPARARLRAEVVANLAAFARGERRNRVD